ncbi:hypothetical protein MSG28_011987 [Choristoneura fumiferana]|uniref:Uncharacterized protein n=1 Tax=Choristoneura fumiferana TaxID=7141 RepID=A0ACC0KN54_CHOFU|nr:hypothetical protein MSG28_011987 [Choristoneura fumiferana]
MFQISIKLCLFVILFKYDFNLVLGNSEVSAKYLNGSTIVPYKEKQIKDLKMSNVSTGVNATASGYSIENTIRRNAGSNVTLNCDVEVAPTVVKPSIKNGYPGSKTAYINQSLQFNCPTTEDTEYTTTWHRVDRSSWEVLSSKTTPDGKDKIIIADDQLFIRRITKEDEGLYKCITTNAAGKDESTTGRLTVLDKVETRNVADVKSEYPQAHESEYIFPVDTDWEINRQHLKLGKTLGEGEFGRVLQAEYVKPSDSPCTVAVKMMKEEQSDADVKAFVLEMEIMKMVGKHENIINLLGCCTQGGPLYVVVEYASNGCLRNYLKKHKPDEKYYSRLITKGGK